MTSKGLFQPKAFYDSIIFFLSEHVTSPSLTSVVLTCPLCAFNSKVFFVFLKYAQVFSDVVLSFRQVLAGCLWSHLSSGEVEQKTNLPEVLLPLIFAK